ncbi:MAG: exodeoxyribonuclease VII small subunit [Spirochaetia bacterium]|nr:exodeoxyribonuclease VII small subunit [Spirochaetia bacterium]
MAKPKENENLTFEEALKELEDIAHLLEEGKETLEKSMELYERGVLLKDFCGKKLKEAEGKWMILRKKKNGDTEIQEIDNTKIPDPNEIKGLQEEMF